jgi:anti-sigma factor RsiW
MGQPIPAQHPSVVLRSHFNLVRTLLIIAMAALIASAAAVVILANDDDSANTASRATPAVQPQTQAPVGTTRYDGGPDEGTRGAIASPPAAGTRYDGGPDEGSRGPAHVQFKERAGGPSFLHEGR